MKCWPPIQWHVYTDCTFSWPKSLHIYCSFYMVNILMNLPISATNHPLFIFFNLDIKCIFITLNIYFLFAGCPFRHSDPELLKQKLQVYKVSPSGISQVGAVQNGPIVLKPPVPASVTFSPLCTAPNLMKLCKKKLKTVLVITPSEASSRNMHIQYLYKHKIRKLLWVAALWACTYSPCCFELNNHMLTT